MRLIAIDNDVGDEPVKSTQTIERTVWEIPGKLFPTFSYTLEDICEMIHSIRGEYVDLCRSTEKLESLCGQIDGVVNTVRMVFLSAGTEKEDRILETITRHFKSESIIQKPKECITLANLEEEYNTDTFSIITTCNEIILHSFRLDKILSRTIFLTDHSYEGKQDMFQHTDVASLLDKVDDLLESYFLSVFAKIIDNYIVDFKDDERTTETVRFANAIYLRSELPQHQHPNFEIGKMSQVSKKVPIQIKHEIVEVDEVLGCGEEGDVLIIDIKQKDCDGDKKTERLVKELLKKHGIENYRICFSEIERHARVEIHSGEGCIMNSKSGALGAFMIEDTRDLEHGGQKALSVLCAGHVVENDDNAFLQAQNKNIGKVSCKYDGIGMDIAKVRVEEDILTFVDVRFQNEADEKVGAYLFENDPSYLAGRCVFLRGASTKLGRGKISSSRYISSDKCRILEIVKRNDDSDYAQKGDSGATVLALERKGKFLYAIGMHLSQLRRDGNRVVYQALFLNDGIDHLMSRDAAPPLRLASSSEVESHIHFDKLAVVEITRTSIRGVKASASNIKNAEKILTNGKEQEILFNDLKPDEIVDKALAFIQPICVDGLHTMVVIGTDVINKATIVRKNAVECSGMTHIEAIGHACAHNDTQPHILLNMDDEKIYFFTSLSSQQATEIDKFDIYSRIRGKCLKKLQRKYEFKQNDKRDVEIKNVLEQFERKLLTFNGDEDIHISVLDSRNVSCDNTERVDVIEVPKAVVIGILKKVCKEIEDKVLAAFSAHGFTGYAVFHLYGALTLCLILQDMLPNTLGDNITKCKCVMKLPERVLHEAGKRLKCNCAIGLHGMPKQSTYIPWKDLDSPYSIEQLRI